MTLTTPPTPRSGVSPQPPLFPHQVTALEFRSSRRPCPEYRAVHYALHQQRGPAREQACIQCGGPALDWAFQYPESGIQVCPLTQRKFSDDVNDYAPMCRSCHLRMDWDEDPEMASALSARRSVVASQAKTPEHVENIWKSRRSNEAGMAQHSKLMSQTMSKTNSRKLRCAECGMTTNAGNLGKHQSASGHVGRQEVSA